MIRVLIVDDDKLVRKGLISAMPWRQFGMTVEGEAANGEKALEFLARQPVDLLLTDLAMPVMSGIELMREVRRRYPHIHIVVLTFHQDFEYVQEALRLGAIDYIAKVQLEKERFDEVLGRVVRQIREREGDGPAAGHARERDNAPLPAPRYAFLSLRTGAGDIPPQAPTLAAQDGRLIDAGRQLWLWRPGAETAEGAGAAQGEAQGGGTIAGARREARDGGMIAGPRGEARDGGIIAGARREAQGGGMIAGARREAQGGGTIAGPRGEARDGGTTAGARGVAQGGGTIAGATAAEGATALPGALRAAFPPADGWGCVRLEGAADMPLQALTAVLHAYRDGAFFYDFAPDGEVLALRVREEAHAQPEWSEDSLARWKADAAPRESLHQDEAFERMLLELEAMRLPKARLLGLLYSLVDEWNRLAAALSLPRAELEEPLDYWIETKRKLLDLRRTLRRAMEKTAYSPEVTAAITRAAALLLEELDRPVTAAEIAGRVHMSRSYFSQCFKDIVGRTFNDYVRHIRMEKAKELLLHTGKTIAWIAESTGYADEKYFSRTFREHTGLLPSEFRAQAQRR